jgi:hypothetical protein
LQFKRGEFANLPSLKAGEPGFTTDKYDLYVGLDNNILNNKFFGSHRYWTRETSSTGSGINLVEGTSNGDDYVTLSAPASVGAAVTYYFPATQGSFSSVLTNDGSGNLSWSSGSNNAVFTGITTFSDTTDNTLGDSNTGSVLFDGGVGIDKNLTVGGNLDIQGYSNFVGVVTFKGGTINLGDQDTDDINVAGEFISNLVPNTDDTYDIGVGDKRWRSANFSGISTFNNVTVGGASTALLVNGNARIVGVLTIGTASITFSGVNNQVTGITTFTGFSDFNEGINVDGHTELDNLAVSGVSTFTGAVDVNGGANISGGETRVSSLTVDDLTDRRLVFVSGDGSLVDDENLRYDGTDLSTGSLVVLDITQNRVLIGGAGSAVEDSENLTFNGSTLTVVGYADLDDVNVSSAATILNATITSANINNTTFGTGTAIIGVDTDLSAVSASDDTLASAKAIKTYVDAQNLSFSAGVGTGVVNLNSQTFAISGTESEIETSASGQTITIGLPDDIIIGAGLTVTGALDVNGGADISGGETTLSSASVSDLTSGRVVVVGTSGSLEDSSNLTYSAGGLIIGAGGINVTGVSTFSSDLVTGGDLTVGGNDIKASDGTTALTLTDATGAVTAANDLTVTGNLYVNGSTTQVNTTQLTVEDTLIELGLVDGNNPGSDVNRDLGILLNYYTNSAKKAAVYWDDSASRIAIASEVSESSSVLTASAYAALEIGSLWVNDCAGASQVISCTGTERFLENITIDGGSF